MAIDELAEDAHQAIIGVIKAEAASLSELFSEQRYSYLGKTYAALELAEEAEKRTDVGNSLVAEVFAQIKAMPGFQYDPKKPFAQQLSNAYGAAALRKPNTGLIGIHKDGTVRHTDEIIAAIGEDTEFGAGVLYSAIGIFVDSVYNSHKI